MKDQLVALNEQFLADLQLAVDAAADSPCGVPPLTLHLYPPKSVVMSSSPLGMAST